MVVKSRLTRRAALAGAAVALPLFHIRTAGAAGRLAVALYQSFVPGWNEAMKRLVEGWGEKNSVEVRIDFLSPINDQGLLVLEAEAQARAGHDVINPFDYLVAAYADKLEPVDDLVAGAIAAHGPLIEGVKYSERSPAPGAPCPRAWAPMPLPARVASTCSASTSGSTSLQLFRQPTRWDRITINGPGMPSCPPPRNASRPAIPSDCRSAIAMTRGNGSMRSSGVSARNSSMPRAT